jgi:hypothetical protein
VTEEEFEGVVNKAIKNISLSGQGIRTRLTNKHSQPIIPAARDLISSSSHRWREKATTETLTAMNKGTNII